MPIGHADTVFKYADGHPLSCSFEPPTFERVEGRTTAYTGIGHPAATRVLGAARALGGVLFSGERRRRPDDR